MATPWTEQALCTQTDPRLFSITRGERHTKAKAVCARCDVPEPCLAEAMLLEGTEHFDARWGVYGGLDPEQRWHLSRGGKVVAIDPVLSTPA